MSRTFEVGRAVLSTSGTNIELWLTTLITISPQQNTIDMQRLRSSDFLDYTSSGKVWVYCDHGMHVDLAISMQEYPLTHSTQCELTESILRAPV